MNVLKEAIRLITQPPGDLVYFLVTLFALQQAFFPALIARRHAPEAPLPRRWLWTLGGLLLGRALLIVIGLLGVVGLLVPAQILPPLERWLEFAGVLLVIWAAVLGTRAARWQTVLMVILLIASLVFYGVTAALWPAWEAASQAFNGWLFEQIWEILTLAMLLIYLLLTLLMRPQEWAWVVGMGLFWLLGHSAQLRWPDVQMHFSGWLRLTSLVVLPLLSVLVHRQVASPAGPPSPAIPVLDRALLQDTLQGVESARDLDPALIIASSKLANLLDVDVCAIALSSEGDQPALKVVALHPPNAAQIEPPVLFLDDYPVLAEAYTQQRAQIVKPTAQALWLTALYNKLGIQKVAPLSIIPLASRDGTLGLLLLSNPESQRPWSDGAFNTQQLVAALFATSVARARKQTQDLSFLSRLRGQDTERQKLESALEQAQTEIQALSGRIAALTQEIQAREKEILQLNQELTSRPEALSETEINFWQEEVQELVKERETLQGKIQELMRDIEVLLHERGLLADKIANLSTGLEALTETRNQLQTQCTTLQEKLAEAEKELASFREKPVNGATVGLVVANAEGQITMADAVARRMLHLPQGDVTGFPINGVYPDPRWTQTVDALLVRNVPNSLKRAHLTLTIEQLTIEADLVTLVGRDGQPDGLAVTLRTSESEAERQEAIIGLANEFRTPMTSITGYTDLLLGEQAGILTEMQRQFLERVKANIEQMNRLLNDLVRTASPDSRPIEISPQAVNLIEIIEEAVMGLAARFRDRKLAVRLDLPPQLPAVRADRDSLYQILLRLISNAALCSRQGTEVVISARQDDASKGGQFIRISVADTGGGIAPEDYPRVFRRFYRASQPLIQGMGETGVGMAMAKTLVEANGGRIWVESQPDVGSTFNFILPINAAKK
ncbi:MAG TPA: ATP-binding protein [Anaerolineae bacterium]|nr:ATP-binding protein [Anaerolineae bacterium]HQK13335.1 ATP-binding protein [Anaerolineae bacterium]